MNLLRKIERLEVRMAPVVPAKIAITPEFRQRAKGIMARVWTKRHERPGLFDLMVKFMRERGRTGEPQQSWFQLEE